MCLCTALVLSHSPELRPEASESRLFHSRVIPQRRPRSMARSTHLRPRDNRKQAEFKNPNSGIGIKFEILQAHGSAPAVGEGHEFTFE